MCVCQIPGDIMAEMFLARLLLDLVPADGNRLIVVETVVVDDHTFY